MRYEVISKPNWDTLPGTTILGISEYYTVPASDTNDVIIIPIGTPSWLKLRQIDLEIIQELQGMPLEKLRQNNILDSYSVLDELFSAGLLFIDGKTGIKVEPTSNSGLQIGKPKSILLKMTGACDMACTYCYDYDPVRWKGIVDMDLAKHLIQECLDPSQRLTIMFHGGEPLLQFPQIKELVAFTEKIAKQKSANYLFSIQTNGLKLDHEIVNFFLKHQFGIGVSLDGPEHVQNLERIDHQGKGTFSRVRKKFDEFPVFMRENVGYITVATPSNITHLNEIWSFFKGMNVKTWKLMPTDSQGRAENLEEKEDYLNLFISFLEERIDEIIAGNMALPYIPNIISLIQPFTTLERKNMCMKSPCGAGSDLLVLDALGTLRACDCAYHPAFQLTPSKLVAIESPDRFPESRKNAVADSNLLDDALSSDNAKALHDRENWLLNTAICKTCKWFHQCAGTCPARALLQNGTIYAIDDLECKTRLKLFPKILKDVAKENSMLRAYSKSYIERSTGAIDQFTNF